MLLERLLGIACSLCCPSFSAGVALAGGCQETGNTCFKALCTVVVSKECTWLALQILLSYSLEQGLGPQGPSFAANQPNHWATTGITHLLPRLLANPKRKLRQKIIL